MTNEEAMKKKIMGKWKKYLGPGTYFDIIDSGDKGEGDIDTLSEIIEDKDKLLDMENEFIDYNFDYIYQVYTQALEEFISDDLSDNEALLIEDEIDFRDELRFEFEAHVNNNMIDLYAFDVLLIEEKTYEVEYDGAQNRIDWSDPDQVNFRKRALNYITKEEFNTILINSYGGVGYIAAIVDGKDLIEATRNGKKTIEGNAVIGIHDWWNGAGYFASSDKTVRIKLKDANIDTGDYSVGGVFGTGEWKY